MIKKNAVIFEACKQTKAVKKRSPSPKADGYLTFSFLLFLNIASAFALVITLIHKGILTPHELLLFTIFPLSILMILQGIFNLYWMIYAWEDPKRMEKNKSPKHYKTPFFSFSAILPARHEESVIGETIKAISEINYPQNLMELIVVCRFDDVATIKKVEETKVNLPKTNLKLEIFSDTPINKPHALNIGLQKAKGDIVAVFDAEDEPHQDIYQIVNTVMLQDKIDVVQSGVQLMNFRSHWFSALNVLEYFFWFKSTLLFFTKLGFAPLGGNTVFFKKNLLQQINGWDENCLTEDCDIGIRLSVLRAKIKVVYDARHVTAEETPASVGAFIRQRTRWNQGFLQVLLKGDFLKLPRISQRVLAFYILLWPQLQALLFVYMPFALLMILLLKLPVWLTILSTLPFYLFFLQQVTYNIGLYEFCKEYKMKYPLFSPLRLFLTAYPFAALLGYSAFRAVLRLFLRQKSWEKTMHFNAHRIQTGDFKAGFAWKL